jgi:hypothetical protein
LRLGRGRGSASSSGAGSFKGSSDKAMNLAGDGVGLA